jgi:Na+-translocating ferredoxin:NAD+ oxidoreductase RnfC subunit
LTESRGDKKMPNDKEITCPECGQNRDTSGMGLDLLDKLQEERKRREEAEAKIEQLIECAECRKCTDRKICMEITE